MSVSAEELLHPLVRGWMAGKGWSGLRPMQERAVRTILGTDGDVIVSAGTASGKTEAAFLPAVSTLLRSPPSSVGILAISPLKSLINDQHGRLSDLGRHVDLAVTRWHGETPPEEKRALRREPQGIAIITPESLEAMILNRRGDVARLFGGVRFVVVDEMHAFLAGDRGAHVASLLARLDRLVGRRARRIGLSATLGDPAMAALWLRPADPDGVALVEEEASARRIACRIECHVEKMPPFVVDEVLAEEQGYETGVKQMAASLFPRLRGEKSLVFTASRRTVEALADGLSRQAERAGCDTPFLPHHGSLAKSYREKVEAILREPGKPATAVATTTLELGIDIGEVSRVVQVGPPRSMASLRQRVGRSGRREGTVPTLDLQVSVRKPGHGSSVVDELYPDLVCGLASLHLLNSGFVEPPSEPASLSVLVHQIACIAKSGPTDTDRIGAILRDVAPFRAFGPDRLRDLLVRLSAASCGILSRLGNGVVVLGDAGRRMLEGPDAFSVFSTPVEFTLVHYGIELGSVPVVGGVPVAPGDNLLFQGKRWSVDRVDLEERQAHVLPAPKAASLKFEGGEPAPMHDLMLATMRKVYEIDAVPRNIDAVGAKVLARARSTYGKLKLSKTRILQVEGDVVVLPFVGTLRLRALSLALQAEGLQTYLTPYTLVVEKATAAEAGGAILEIARGSQPLAEIFANSGAIPAGKFDGGLDPVFRASWWAAVNDLERVARETASAVVAQPSRRKVKAA